MQRTKHNEKQVIMILEDDEDLAEGIRACLKNAFREMCFTICGEFIPNLGGIAGYVD